ncbi:MAG: bifunctional molybdenum cofactor biosynthesis protein MoaC/MoaB [Armatimonadetes bacterium]|nr:bifunctional molybdenum cofactor biosynthesis protein MoaC/MoaB [Armatimonadota bacterium]
MRDISHKFSTLRTARAQAVLIASAETVARVQAGDTPKGDPVPVARVAAVQAAKKTTEWIPYCHNIPIEFVGVDFSFEPDRIIVEVSITSVAKTGVEMEAITAAAASVITLYDMLKMIDESMEIGSIHLLEKRGGKSDLPHRSGWLAKVIVVSDRASTGTYADQSGPILQEVLQANGALEVEVAIVADDVEKLRDAITSRVTAGIDMVFVTGGTGIGPRDITFEAVTPLLERSLPGVVSAFQSYSQDRVPTAMLARPVAGLIGNTLVVAIPGSPRACVDAVNALMPNLLHFIDMLKGTPHP